MNLKEYLTQLVGNECSMSNDDGVYFLNFDPNSVTLTKATDIVYKVVEAHEDHVVITSVPKRGRRQVLRLPFSRVVTSHAVD